MRLYLFIISFYVGFSVAFASNLWTDHGAYSIAWFNSTKTEFEISTAEDFAGIAVLQNGGYTNFSNKTIILTDDINLSGKDWIPIGTKLNPFMGKIIGNGHTIKGISINFRSDIQYFGLFGGLREAVLSDFDMDGKIDVVIDNYYTVQYVGSCCGYATKTNFSNITSKVKVNYQRERNSSDMYEIYIGGIAGYLSDCELNEIHFESDYHAHFGDSSPYGGYLESSDFNFGGLFAAGYNSNINYCSVRCNAYVYLGGSENLKSSNSVGFGGISDHPSSCLIQGCWVIIDCIEINHSWKPGLNGAIYLGGISVSSSAGNQNVKRGIKNCYAAILEVKTHLPSGRFSYGGIMSHNWSDLQYFPDQFVSNYSNSDLQIDNEIGDLSIAQYNEGYNGYDYFSSEEMKSQEFTDELNLYYTLNGKNPQWYFDGFNYPYIDEEKAGIEETTDDNDLIDIQEVFNVQGDKVGCTTANLPKGIYIVRQGNFTKKIIVK